MLGVCRGEPVVVQLPPARAREVGLRRRRHWRRGPRAALATATRIEFPSDGIEATVLRDELVARQRQRVRDALAESTSSGPWRRRAGVGGNAELTAKGSDWVSASGAARRSTGAARAARYPAGDRQLRRSRRAVSLLRDRRLAALLVAVSSAGTQMTWLALPWFVLRSTNSPQRMTWVIIAEVIPVACSASGAARSPGTSARVERCLRATSRVPLFCVPVLHAAGALPSPCCSPSSQCPGVFLARHFSVQRAVVPGSSASRRRSHRRRRCSGCKPPRSSSVRRWQRPDQPDGHRERVVRRRSDLPRVVPDRRRVREVAGGRGRGTADRSTRRRAVHRAGLLRLWTPAFL